MSPSRTLITALCWSLAATTWPGRAAAQQVQLAMENGMTALADYREGDPRLPAVLILHGFLQTYHFSIVQKLADELADAGYTILAPNLTLGVDSRSEPLTCSAIQNHRFEDSDAELVRWLDWLQGRGHVRVAAIGHSSGAARLVHFLTTPAGKRLAAVIAVSPTFPAAALAPEAQAAQIARARANLARDARSVDRYTLGYCQDNYVAPPAAALSWSQVTPESLASGFRQGGRRLMVIWGSADRVVPDSLRQVVAGSGVEYHTVEGANHFFSDAGEFELFDLVLAHLEALGG